MPNVTQTLNVRVAPDLRKRIEKIARDNKWTINQATIAVLTAGLETVR
jgi:predicted HicB family RNase H-like nuclease